MVSTKSPGTQKMPALIINKDKCLNNISRMAKKAAAHNLNFRPHFKTHQSHEVGSWFKDFGVDCITVSSVTMAAYFSNDWNDITIAFPFNIHEVEEVNELQERIKLNLLIASTEVADVLEKRLHRRTDIYIKIDTGYRRTGIQADAYQEIEELVSTLSKSQKLRFAGFISHAGHSYQARSKNQILAVHQQNIDALNALRQRYVSVYPDLVISTGDTPTCSVADNWQGITEIRPGNFVYYDLMQQQIGSCTIDEIAVSVACPVVAIHPQRAEVVVYGGAVHLSKDFITENGQRCYGLPVELSEQGWGMPIHGAMVKSLSQEHGIISMDEPFLSKIKVGDVIGVLPVHSCLTADLLRRPTVI